MAIVARKVTEIARKALELSPFYYGERFTPVKRKEPCPKTGIMRHTPPFLNLQE